MYVLIRLLPHTPLHMKYAVYWPCFPYFYDTRNSRPAPDTAEMINDRLFCKFDWAL